jgi:RNA polymerase sigma factor (sigma-70 family)
MRESSRWRALILGARSAFDLSGRYALFEPLIQIPRRPSITTADTWALEQNRDTSHQSSSFVVGQIEPGSAEASAEEAYGLSLSAVEFDAKLADLYERYGSSTVSVMSAVEPIVERIEQDAKDARRSASLEDVERFTAFYRSAVPKLVAFLRWQGASIPDAADAVQEAMTMAYKRWATLREPYAWSRTVASRIYARHVAAVRDDLADDSDLSRGSPLLPNRLAIADLEGGHEILRLLDSLPMRQRQILAWTYDGATTDEIASALQLSPETVQSYLRIARKRLQEHLEQQRRAGESE